MLVCVCGFCMIGCIPFVYFIQIFFLSGLEHFKWVKNLKAKNENAGILYCSYMVSIYLCGLP